MKQADRLRATIQSGKRLVVFLHDNPDPDALAAGWLLERIGRSCGVRTVLAYGGRLGRAENRTMVKLLKIPARSIEQRPIRYMQADRYALVDTQPGTGNNSFAHDRRRCHIVVDHHPRKGGTRADFVDIRPGQGTCTTMLLAYHQGLGLPMEPDLATAAVYAVISETQDLEREASPDDRRAFQRLMPRVRLRALGRIRHPVHGRAYYRTIARAMRHVLVSRHACICHIGSVHQAEMVAEIADFLIPMDRVTWVLVTGFHRRQMILSIRTTHPRAHAERVMRRVLDRLGKGGGHGMIAGGAMPCEDLDRYRQHTPLVTDRFLAHLSRRGPQHLKPLLQEGGPGSPA